MFSTGLWLILLIQPATQKLNLDELTVIFSSKDLNQQSRVAGQIYYWGSMVGIDHEQLSWLSVDSSKTWRKAGREAIIMPDIGVTTVRQWGRLPNHLTPQRVHGGIMP